MIKSLKINSHQNSEQEKDKIFTLCVADCIAA